MPVVTVTTTLPGAGPEEIEAQVTKIIEEAINTVSGIDELRSVTREGLSQVIVQFVLEKDLGIAAQEVRDKVGTVLADLPEDADPPIVEKFDIDATPIATITVSGFRGLKELTEIAENQVKEPLESVTGVGAIDVLGGRKREIQILIDPDRLKAYGLAIRTVAQALAKQNVEFPGGRITQESGETVLRTLGRVKSVREFEDIVVATNDGVPITLADIGRVEDGVEEPRSLSRYDGKNAVSLIIRKQSGSNTVAAVEAIQERLVDIRQLLPAGYRSARHPRSVRVRQGFGPRGRAASHPGLAVCQHHRVFLSRQSALDINCRGRDSGVHHLDLYTFGRGRLFPQSHHPAGAHPGRGHCH